MAENSKSRESTRGGSQGAGQSNEGNSKGTSNRGFASMDPELQRKIARKGGEAVSGNREHMAQIGKKGGEASSGGRKSAR
jgi:uncharacterized protein